MWCRLPAAVVAGDAALAAVAGAVAAAAFVQLLRIHRNSQHLSWTRQKTFHLMIGLCNLGFLLYFVFSFVSTCEKWFCWSHGCGLLLMACPQLLFMSIFLLLLSFWIDLCHETNDEDEDDTRSYNEALLDRTMAKPDGSHAVSRRKCCSFDGIHVGSRQKIVILVVLLAFFAITVISALIWFGRGQSLVDSLLLKKVYLDIYSVVTFLLGGALACYGLLLFSKMSKIRSETVSSEKWKVASLAAVSLVCFTVASVVALVTNVAVLLPWEDTQLDTITNMVIMFLYYFVGSLIPSAVVLWVMRDMPARQILDRAVQPRVVNVIRSVPSPSRSHWRTAVASSNKAPKGSPI